MAIKNNTELNFSNLTTSRSSFSQATVDKTVQCAFITQHKILLLSSFLSLFFGHCVLSDKVLLLRVKRCQCSD